MKFNINSPAYLKIDPQAYDLLQKMLKIDPKKRISAK
jgi:serine/threonine protein kinase